MRIISKCKMVPGTFDAKFKPLEKVTLVDEIYVLRKTSISGYKKLHFIILPKIARISVYNSIITPFLLTYQTIRTKSSIILAYHFIPHAFFAYLASLLTKKPFIIGQTGLLIQRKAQSPFFGPIIKHVAKKALYLNVPGSMSKLFWIKLGIPEKKINILHSSIDTNYFIPTNSSKEFDFIYLGRIAPEKQIWLLIDGLKYLHNKGIEATLLIVGDGPELEYIYKRVNDLKLVPFVTFTGFQEDVLKWLNRSRIFLLASKSEGLPTALMQAMSCELLCISSDVGNIPDLISHGENGFLFDHTKPEDLRSLMLESYINYSKYVYLAKKARRIVELNHSYHSAISKWTEILGGVKT